MDDMGKLLASMRAAFSPSPLRIVIAMTVLCLFAVALVVFCAHEFKRQGERRKRRSEQLYVALRDSKKLLPSDEAIIGRMVATLSTMNKRHLLLTNQALFDACARRLLKKGALSPSEASELRAKLDFSAEGQSGALQLRLLPLQPGYHVTIRDTRGLLKARVIDIQASSIQVRFDAGGQDIFFLPDSEVDILYRNWRGVFVLHSAVISQDGEILSLTHDVRAARMNRLVRSSRKIGVRSNLGPA
jgi:hypothetical protein